MTVVKAIIKREAGLVGAVTSNHTALDHFLHGDMSGITGDAALIWGDASRIKGNVGGMSGDVSKIHGDVSKIGYLFDDSVTYGSVGVSKFKGDLSGMCINIDTAQSASFALAGDFSNLKGTIHVTDSTFWSGDVSKLSGDMTGITGFDPSFVNGLGEVRGDISNLNGDVACTGDLSNIYGTLWPNDETDPLNGDVSGLKGDITGVYGVATGLIGDLDLCNLSTGDRTTGVDISTLTVSDSE